MATDGAQLDMITDVFNRLVESCHAKCISPRYAEADLNAKAASEALLIHVNTAHHRLGRIAERTGRDLRRLSDVIDLLIAIRITDGPAA